MSDDNRDFQKLLEQVQQGSEEAARELTQRYGPHLRRCIRRSLSSALRPKFDSIDFVQLVWASFFHEPERLPALETPEQLAAYLAGMARNKVLGTGRQLQSQKQNVQREVRLDRASPGAQPVLTSRDPTPSAMAIFHEEWDRLIADQPDKVRRILTLRYAGHTFGEIGAQLDLHERTVRRVIEQLEATRQAERPQPLPAGTPNVSRQHRSE